MTLHYKDTFRGTAWYYARYREGYPDEFFTMLAREFSLTDGGRVLDLGCGTGQIALPISEYVREVIAMDPEPEMIAEGKTQAKKKNVQNIIWIEGGSEDLSAMRESIGEIKLAVIGTAFHWMKRDETLDTLYEMIDDGGGISVVWNTSIWTKPDNEWQAVVTRVIKKYLGEQRRAGSGTYTHPGKRHGEIVGESRFKRIKTWELHWSRSLTFDEVIGNLYSTSMANPYILGGKKEAFEKDLRGALLKVSPAGVFTSEGDAEAILAWK